MNPPKTKTFKDFIFFLTLFVVCIVGSIGIFIFAVGLESGNAIVVGAMKALLDNFYLIFFSLLLFNLFIFLIYKRKRS